MKVSVNWLTLLPVLVPALAAILVLLVDAVLPRRTALHWWFAAAALVGGMVATVPAARAPVRTLCGSGQPCLYAADRVTAALQLAAFACSLVAVLLAVPVRRASRLTAVEASAVLSATAGAVGVGAARDLGAWLVLLELATLPLVALVAFRARRTAVDGALSMLTTALTSFGVTAVGAALWFSATGSATFLGDAAAQAMLDDDKRRGVVLAVLLLVAGVAFKLSLAPFHAWTPEAFDGASTPIGALLATTSKIAAVAALVVVLRSASAISSSTLYVLGALALASMTLGNLMALREQRTLRFLAWSTIAQAGWVVLPLSTVDRPGLPASVAYLVVYAVATLVVFAVVTLVAHADGRDAATDLSAYRGILRTRPVAGLALALALLVLAGLPPGVVGLVAKVAAIVPVVHQHAWWLAIGAALNAMLGVAVYLRWLWLLWQPAGAAQRDPAHPVHRVVVALGLLALVVTSVLPGTVLAFLR
ncbi:hypothetical protein G9U51_05465 [Calidifontibacter sp. DB0510]|uniref:NADH:quinone oxidoreductase/Mrp antiporter transmembrane domain-containing protein n=1 Tax=Metallococcus carri TaxID=1656884 RepID=A0A967E9V8_9MICO|nr:proton-conducting transporter membrane subunit [Metallococcus carri]NHN55234.1 hypothetical protein [Metallococcus carri]NOP36311.1 hypothetical protein [Calidifontibacter sp. DB2511S]